MAYDYLRPTSHWKPKKRRTRTSTFLAGLMITAKWCWRFLRRRQAGFWKSLVTLALIFIIFGSIVGLAAFAWVSRDLPDPNALLERDVAQTTKIYDRTGEQLLYEIHGDKKRTLVQLEEIPQIVKEATIAIEDQQFYKHRGFNPFRIVVGVVWGMVTKGRPQGGSTITQQLVKNAILTGERTITRKIKELMLSIAIEQRLSKDDILQLYLNEIGYGSSNYGVEAASRAYFGKSVKDVTLAQAATLAALPKAPTTYLNNSEKLDARRDLVLKIMFEQGYITEEEKIAAQNDEVEIIQKTSAESTDESIQALHFVFYVKQLLIDELGLDERQIEQGGLSVVTTLDYGLQGAAEAAVRAGVTERGDSYGFGDAALVAVDPKTGQVLSMVGSPDYFNEEIDGAINMALQPIQPGSSIKPIVYTAGFAAGYTPDSLLYDVLTTFKTAVGDYTPHNYHLEMENGPVSIRKALQGSLNIPAVKMITLLGLDEVLDFAESLGYSTFSDHSKFGPAMVLGGGEVRLLEHAAVFGVLANNGIKQETAAVLKVTDADGNILHEWKEKSGKEVLPKNIAWQISDVLSDNAARSYIFGANNRLTLPDRPVAAKTGTTNDNRAALTVGYTPSISAAVWVGNADYSAMSAGADGSVVAAPIWQAFMMSAHQGRSIEAFPEPEILPTGKDILDGRLTLSNRGGASCMEYHSELYYINPADPLGATPEDQPSDEQYLSWEAGVQSWVQRLTEQDPSKLPFAACQETADTGDGEISVDEDGDDGVQIIDPVNEQTIEKTKETYSVVVELEDYADVSSVRLMVRSADSADAALADTMSGPESPFVTLRWTLPASGDYVLYAQADEKTSGQILVKVRGVGGTSDALDVTSGEARDAETLLEEILP